MSDNMCTKDEAKKASEKAIEETLFLADGNGHTRFAKEVHSAVFEEGEQGEPSRFQRELKKAFYQTFGKWFLGGGVAILLGLAGIYYQVENNTERIEEGGRFTQEEFDTYREAEDAKDETDRQRLDRIENKLDTIISNL